MRYGDLPDLGMYKVTLMFGEHVRAEMEQHEGDRYQAWLDGRLPTVDGPAQPILVVSDVC